MPGRLGKLLDKQKVNKKHRFSWEVFTTFTYEHGILTVREFFDRKTDHPVAYISSRDNILYVDTYKKDVKQYRAAINEAGRMSKPVSVSEYIGA